MGNLRNSKDLDTLAKKKKLRKKRNLMRIIIGSATVTLAIILGILFAILTNTIIEITQGPSKKVNASSISTIVGEIKDIPSGIRDFKEMTEPLGEEMNILIMGTDINYSGGRATEEGYSRTDTMMLVNVDPNNKKVNVLSIPRDTKVIIPGKLHYDKINAAYAYGGEQLAKQTVANITGVTIHRFMVLKVGGLVNLVDLIGGIDIYVDRNMFYSDRTAGLYINIPKGWNHLDGTKAHSFVRFRHDAYGDIGRVERQQAFVRAVIDKMLSPSSLMKFPQLIREGKSNIITDLSTQELFKLANFAKDLKKENIKMVMLPGRFGNEYYVSYWIMDELQTKGVISELFPSSIYSSPSADAQEEEINKKKYRITVLNGTIEPRLAAKVARQLRDKGWVVWSVSQSTKIVDTTQIIAQTAKSKPIPVLTTDLGVTPEVIHASIGDITTDYTIIVGKDYSNYLKQQQEALSEKLE